MRLRCGLSIGNKKYKKNELVKIIEVNKGIGWTLEMITPSSDDTLTLVLDITILEGSKKCINLLDNDNKTESMSRNYHQDQLTKDLDHLFQSKKYADVTISCGDNKFDCHKIILASRSHVFEAMFDSNMKEMKTGKVEIQDMDPEVLGNLLQYIYTGVAPNIDTMAKELFAAADQYQIEKLKELCEEKLMSTIDVDNCIDHLVLGDLYHAPRMRAKALKFVAQNIVSINSSEWKETLVNYPTFMVEVMEMMMPKSEKLVMLMIVS